MPNFAMYIKNPFLIAAIFVILGLVHGRTLPMNSSDNIEPKFNPENWPRNDYVNRPDQTDFRRFNHTNTERISVGTYLSLIKFGTRKLIHPKKLRFLKKGYCFQKCIFLYKNHHHHGEELLPMEHFPPDYHHFRSLNTDYRWPFNNHLPPNGGYQPETYRPMTDLHHHHHHVHPPINSFPFTSDLHNNRFVHPMMYWHYNGYLPLPLL